MTTTASGAGVVLLPDLGEDIEEADVLQVYVSIGDDVVLAVFRRAPLPEIEEKALFLLNKCSFEGDHPFFVQVGLKGEDVFVLAARMERSQVYRMVDAFEFIRTLYADTGL